MNSRVASFAVVAIVSLAASILSLSAQSVDAWAGVWKLNVAKSTYALSPAPMSAISVLEPSGDDWKESQDVVDAQGAAAHVELAFKFDGKDYSVADAPNMTWAFTRLGDHAYELVVKRDGKVTATARTVVSPDGKTRTTTTAVTNAQGETHMNVAVYERQ